MSNQERETSYLNGKSLLYVRPIVLCTLCTYKDISSESCLQLFKELVFLLPLSLKFLLGLKPLLIKR